MTIRHQLKLKDLETRYVRRRELLNSHGVYVKRADKQTHLVGSC